jgi:hypothetical protein
MINTMNETEAHPESISGRLAAYFEAHKAAMTNEWVTRVRKDSAIDTDTMTTPQIISHVPHVFDAVIQALRQHTSDATMEQLRENTATHAIVRWQQEYHLPAVLRELSALRTVFIHHLQTFEESHPDVGVARRLFAQITIHRILDEAVFDATESFLKLTRDQPERSGAGRKAATTRKRRLAGKKAAVTRKRRSAGRKAAATRARQRFTAALRP